ncbi:hypothetical protein LPB41_04590 [Thalassospira sp. MA62]|nr:hypothetical protein [Thalassospira sp. MA62]
MTASHPCRHPGQGTLLIVRRSIMMFAMMVGIYTVMQSPVLAADQAAESTDEEEMVAPVIPETVVVPDPVSLTVVLRNTEAIRQIVFTIWLEAENKQSVSVIEQRLPKVINAFLIELQRLMYRDTQQRYENRPKGKRGFNYTGPELLAPPPPKTEDELAAEAEAAEAAAEKGEELVQEPPFTPFPPATNRYFAALQNKLLDVGRKSLPDNTLRSVQIRQFYDYWPNDAKRN